MSQHFLLSKAARTLSLASVARMSDEEARATFARIRWADNGGEAYCPRCGCVKVYTLGTRPGWKCSGCKYQFSVTSMTIFADRKRPVRDYLLAIAIFANGAKGHSALQLSRDLACQYRTAFVLAHKLREAIEAEQRGLNLSGTVEVDGAYFVRRARPSNKVAERVKGLLPSRRVVVVMREREGRTVTVVVPREGDAVPAINERVALGSVIHADEAGGWNRLYARYDMKRINHSVAYSLDGACTNQAESYFSRLRRAEFGIHHRISGQYLNQYSAEMAWREDNRRVSNGEQFKAIAALAIRHPVSSKWCGYWERHEARP
jgi:transposase-like protein